MSALLNKPLGTSKTAYASTSELAAALLDPIFALLFFAFNSQSPLLIGISVAVYLGLLFITKTKKNQLEDYLEQANVEAEADTAV